MGALGAPPGIRETPGSAITDCTSAAATTSGFRNMNFFIFLTLLWLGMASAAPKVDHSLDAQSNLWMVTPGAALNTAKDTINNAAVEKTPEVLEKDNQEQSEEEESIRTAMNAPGYINLRIKITKGIFDMIKGITRKSALGKIAKGIGKQILGSKKAQILGETGKKIGKKILGEITNPENLGDIAYEIGKQILGGKKTQESLTTPNMPIEELLAEDILTPEPEH